jgi:hypothetical protein
MRRITNPERQDAAAQRSCEDKSAQHVEQNDGGVGLEDQLGRGEESVRGVQVEIGGLEASRERHGKRMAEGHRQRRQAAQRLQPIVLRARVADRRIGLSTHTPVPYWKEVIRACFAAQKGKKSLESKASIWRGKRRSDGGLRHLRLWTWAPRSRTNRGSHLPFGTEIQ